MIELRRRWAMPNKNTFEIKPISELLTEIIKPGDLWIDPYSAGNRRASVTNDLNLRIEADHHLEAIDFLKIYPDNSIDGVLFDPPYSIRQVNEVYEKVGGHVINDGYYARAKDEIARIIKPGGKCISFGWDTNGLGNSRGFEDQIVLDIPHGSRHRDTLVIVQEKRKGDLNG